MKKYMMMLDLIMNYRVEIEAYWKTQLNSVEQSIEKKIHKFEINEKRTQRNI